MAWIKNEDPWGVNLGYLELLFHVQEGGQGGRVQTLHGQHYRMLRVCYIIVWNQKITGRRKIR